MNKKNEFCFFSLSPFSLCAFFILKVIFFIFLFMGISFADLPGGIEITTDTACGVEGYALFDSIIRTGGVPSENDCINAGNAFSATILAYAKYTDGNCFAGYGPIYAPCTVMLITICCDETWVITQAKKTAGTVASGTIIDVPIGNEKTVADNLYSQFDSEIAYPDYSGQSLVRTDGVKGMMYQVAMGTDETTSTVAVEMWKVGGYAAVGQVTPVEGVGEGGGSGGGISKADTQDAVHDALTSVNLTNTMIRQSMDDAWDRAHSLGYAGYTTGGSGGGGLSLADTQTAVKNALDTTGSGYVETNDPYSGFIGSSDPYSTAYSHEAFNTTNAPSLANSWSAFKTDIAEAPIMGLSSGFFAGVPTSGDPVLVEFNAGVFGEHSYSFAGLGTAMSVLRGVMLVIFSFIAVKVVVLKGGGG